MKPIRSLAFASLAIAGALLTGCASQSNVPSPSPSWAQATGQVQSKGGKVPVVGEIVIRYDQENFLAEVTKGPSLPLIRLQATGAHPERVAARGVLARGTWSGSPANAPDALKAWVALPEAFHKAQAQARGDRSFQVTIPQTNVSVRKSGGKPSVIEIERGGETIICRLDG